MSNSINTADLQDTCRKQQVEIFELRSSVARWKYAAYFWASIFGLFLECLA